MKPRLVVLAGPNGAGKTTFYRLYLQESGLPFLNADVLQVNTGMDAYEAARTVDAARLAYLEVRAGFITETVFSADHQVILPEGTRLTGEVTFAMPARRFHRAPGDGQRLANHVRAG